MLFEADDLVLDLYNVKKLLKSSIYLSMGQHSIIGKDRDFGVSYLCVNFSTITSSCVILRKLLNLCAFLFSHL